MFCTKRKIKLHKSISSPDNPLMSSLYSDNQTEPSFCLMVTLIESTRMAVLWLTGTFRNIKTTVCELTHLTRGPNEDNRRWDCLVDFSDWGRLLLKKAWETPKQALQLVTCLSHPDLPGPVLLQSESSAAITARHSSPRRLVL